jgi:2-polyprenyl-3-methyl-5-hydroxy-6-metoxy-1,4-benzoquinol methylase
MTATTKGELAERDAAHDAQRDALAARVFEATLGAFDLLAIHLGSRLGLYAALADGGALTTRELANAAGIAPRYAKEWLEHQAVGGLLDVDDVTASAEARRYRLPSGHAEVLVDGTSLSWMAPMAGFLVAAAGRADQLAHAYRTGTGLAWDGYGDVLLESQAAINRPAFEGLLPTEWVPALPDIEARLRQPGARIADVACGVGWSTLALARAYPEAHVDGVDLDAWSIRRARENAAAAAIGDRVSFVQADAADPNLVGRYDLVTILEAVHDLARPVEVLRAVRGMLAPAGAVLVLDERVAEAFTAPGDDVERLMYGYSILFCLPNGLADQPSAGTGTVMRPATLESYARQAGFSRFSVLPVEHDTFRLYRLDAGT